MGPGESTAPTWLANPVEASNSAAGKMKFNNVFDSSERCCVLEPTKYMFEHS